MDCRHVTIIALACAGLSGCLPQQHAQRQLLERELRLQEDYIYDLEYELEQAHEQLACCGLGTCAECGTVTSSDGPADGDSPSSPSPTFPPDPPGQVDPPGPAEPPSVTLPDIDLPDVEVELPGGDIAPPFEGPPSIIPVDPGIPEGQRRGSSSSSGPHRSNSAQQAELGTAPGTLTLAGTRSLVPLRPPVVGPTEQLAPGTPAMLEDWQVSSITINQGLTGPLGSAGSGGLVVFIEPRNARQEIVETAGDVSIVALDPAVEGDAARVGRWDFTSAEAASRLRRTTNGSGLHFQLPWPGRIPRNSALKLFVRLIADDGRALVAELPIDLSAEGQAQQAWTGRIETALAQERQPAAIAGPPWFGIQPVGWKAAAQQAENTPNAASLSERGAWSPNR